MILIVFLDSCELLREGSQAVALELCAAREAMLYPMERADISFLELLARYAFVHCTSANKEV